MKLSTDIYKISCNKKKCNRISLDYSRIRYHYESFVVVVVVAIVNNQKSRLILVNMEVLHWRV